MDEFTVDAFVNRDEPIPVVQLDHQDDLSEEADGSSDERKRDRLKQHGRNIKENIKKVHDKAADRGSSMQDRLLEKYILHYPSTRLLLTCEIGSSNKLYQRKTNLPIEISPPLRPIS